MIAPRIGISALLLSFALLVADAASAPRLKPDIVVATDGSGNFTTVQAAVDSVPANNRERRNDSGLSLTFAEPVTVKGKPAVSLADGKSAAYQSGSGTTVLTFKAESSSAPSRLKLNGGAIIASHASAHLRAVADSVELTK